ncbi:hypothetical protein ACJX0J_022689, partial [Zea mays]
LILAKHNLLEQNPSHDKTIGIIQIHIFMLSLTIEQSWPLCHYFTFQKLEGLNPLFSISNYCHLNTIHWDQFFHNYFVFSRDKTSIFLIFWKNNGIVISIVVSCFNINISAAIFLLYIELHNLVFWSDLGISFHLPLSEQAYQDCQALQDYIQTLQLFFLSVWFLSA